MLPQSILKKIESAYGYEINASGQCSSLAADIYNKTKSFISKSTAQRCFGFSKDHDRQQRLSTLSTIAKYCGYGSYELMLADLGETDCDISRFSDIEEFYSDELCPGSQLKVTWEPARELRMTYLGDNQYIVNEVVGSRNLQIGDKLSISHMAIGFPMLANELQREGYEPKPYQCGLIGGLTSIVEL